MKDEQTFWLFDPETGERYGIPATLKDYQKEGDTWAAKFEFSTTKTQLVFFEMARYIAMAKPGAPGVDEARKILQTVYGKLEAIEIGTHEDNTRFFCNWRVKPGIQEAAVNKEMQQLLSAPILHSFVAHVFGITQKPDQVEIKKGGGGVRISGHWTRAKFTPAMAKKGTRNITAEEMRLEFALAKLLRDYSTHRDKEHPLYLLGNAGEEFEEVAVRFSNGGSSTEQVRVGIIEVPPAALYKTYTGKQSTTISGKERRRIDTLLERFQSDIETYYFKEEQRDGSIKWIEFARPKITFDKIANLTKEEAEAREAGGELPDAKTIYRIRLHPLFTLDISKKYSLFPDDLTARIDKAIGGGRGSGKYWLLSFYLNGIRGHKKETPADLDTLIEKMDLGRFRKKQGLPATIAEVESAIQVAQEIGLVSRWTKEPGAQGQPQYQFKFNPEFGKD